MRSRARNVVRLLMATVVTAIACGSQGEGSPVAPTGGSVVPPASSVAGGAYGVNSVPAGTRMLYQANFHAGIDSGLLLQGPRTESFAVVGAPSGRSGNALRISISRTDNSSAVANGVPRAEISVAGTRLASGVEYWIEWNVYLPFDYQFDAAQPEGIAQVHQGPNVGTPPLSLTLAGGRYQVDIRDGNGRVVASSDAGPASVDRGRWVRWSMHYLPDATGRRSISEVLKNGTVVAAANGRPNAYPGDNAAFFKAGIYKWWWQERPSDVTTRTLYLADVSIAAKG